MKFNLLIAVVAIIALAACKKKEVGTDFKSPSDSFMPLTVGNYWRSNAQNFTEIRGTVNINGEVYYHLYSLVGGDAISQDYLRLDANETLISSSPNSPNSEYIKAKFNANVGDSFQTTGDQSYNDAKVTVVEKTPTKMTFSYDMIYHPNLKGHPYTQTYLKGFGFDGQWKSMSISGKVFNR